MTFPGQCKTAAVDPIFKSEDKIDKKIYRPVSILNSQKNSKMSLKFKSHHLVVTKGMF